ncbi:MAG: hypothetical protein GY696_29280 [Gammaproteobacteria bacterium]|nr:hypothetical protein [Gammaproteobacteria bacterium]
MTTEKGEDNEEREGATNQAFWCGQYSHISVQILIFYMVHSFSHFANRECRPYLRNDFEEDQVDTMLNFQLLVMSLGISGVKPMLIMIIIFMTVEKNWDSEKRMAVACEEITFSENRAEPVAPPVCQSRDFIVQQEH